MRGASRLRRFCRLALLLSALMLPLPAFGRPHKWLGRHTCTSHPESGYGPHVGYSANGAIQFVIRTSYGTPTATYCPGEVHQLQIIQPHPGLALVTSDQAGLAPDPELDPDCVGWRVMFDDMAGFTSSITRSFNTTIVAPCSGTPLTLKATTSTSQYDALITGNVTVLADPSCAAPRCANASPAPVLPSASAPYDSASKDCTPSLLGYSCVADQGAAKIHFSYADSRLLPDNICTKASRAASYNGTLGNFDWLHMAVEATTDGYVSLSFPEVAGTMNPSDAIIGWLSPSGKGGSVGSYLTTGYSVGEVSPNAGWASNMGVAKTSSGSTVVCFSRNPSSSATKARVALSLDQAVPLAWAISNDPDLEMHSHHGALSIDLNSGATQSVSAVSSSVYIRAHAILMILSWMLLLPGGIMVARFKRQPPPKGSTPAAAAAAATAPASGSANAPTPKFCWSCELRPNWFHIHITLLTLGLAAFGASCVIGFVSLRRLSPDTALSNTHEVVGIVLLAMCAVQVAIAVFARPSPGAHTRFWWDLFHKNHGRLLVLSAWINCFVGVFLWETITGENSAPWLGVMGGAVALAVCTNVVLEAMATHKSRAHANAATLQEQLVLPVDASTAKSALRAEAKSLQAAAHRLQGCLMTGSTTASFHSATSDEWEGECRPARSGPNDDVVIVFTPN